MEWIVVALIALFPVELYDPEVPRPQPRGGMRTSTAVRAKPGLQPKGFGGFSKDKFLRSFELQAGKELIPCLNVNVGHLGTLSFLGRLHRDGRLSGARLLGRSPAESCAVTAVEKMRFVEAGQSLQDENIEIQWRFEW